MLRTTLLAMSAALVAVPALAQDRWDGADDLDVNPLACTGEGGAEVVMKDYDGGQPTDAPDLAGQEITLIDVPKLIGIGYFAATTQGMQQAAEELGNVKVTTDGPTEANIDDQITFIDNYITQGDDGSFGIVTSTFTTPNQARWIAEMWAYTQECYPNLEWLETVEAQEDNILSFNQASTLINKYGDD